MAMLAQKIHLAPMMECTDRHFRFLARLLSKHVRLYTEMVTCPALLHGDRQKLLGYDASEHPLVLQLGGSDINELAACAKIAQTWGYDEVNLNCGCPSDRVSSGRFGACLMLEPQRVADCVKAMHDAVSIPVTVKTRIGVDEHDSYAQLCDFIGTVARSGCEVFTVHARKAWLKGLSPKENREVPPLRYDVVAALAKDFPELTFILNGGITSWEQGEQHLQTFAGIMLGREPYRNPMMLAEVDSRFHGEKASILTREEAVLKMIPYAEARLKEGERLHFIARHLHGLFLGVRGGKAFRHVLAVEALKPKAEPKVFAQALEAARLNRERTDAAEAAYRNQSSTPHE